MSEEPSHLRGVLIDNAADLSPFIDGWGRLAELSSKPFGSPPWMLSWWRHAAPSSAALRVVVALEGNEVVGVAPFWLDSGPFSRRMAILGSGVSSTVDLLGDPTRVDEIAQLFAEVLEETKPRPTSIYFEGVPQESPWPAALARAWPSSKPPNLTTEMRMPAPYVPLDSGDFEEWMNSRSSHFRARMRRGVRKLEKAGGTIRLASAESTSTAMEDFIDLHHDRWRDRGGSGVLNPEVEAMLRDIAANDSGLLDMWAIDADDGRSASVQVFLTLGTEMAYWLGGFDDTFAKVRPGPAILSVYKAIEQGFDEGIQRLDLGSGDQSYKYEFTDDDIQLVWMTIVFPSMLSALERMNTLPLRARIAVSRRVPPNLKRRVRRAYGAVRSYIKRGR